MVWFIQIRPTARGDGSAQLDNHCCNQHVERIGQMLAHTTALFTHAVTASISRTHSQCQRGAYRPKSVAEATKRFASSLEKMVEPIGIEPMTSSLQS